MVQSPPAVTRFIWLFTLAAIAVVATLSVVIYRNAASETVAQHSSQQLAMVRTAAVAVEAEIRSMSAQLRQFNSLPSVQNHRSGAQPARARRLRRTAQLAHQPDRPRRRAGPATSLDAGRDTDSREGNRHISIRNCGSGRRIARTSIRFVSIHGWANSVPSRRALVVPVWRTAPSAENPKPSNDFNGVLALVIDLQPLRRGLPRPGD